MRLKWLVHSCRNAQLLNAYGHVCAFDALRPLRSLPQEC